MGSWNRMFSVWGPLPSVTVCPPLHYRPVDCCSVRGSAYFLNWSFLRQHCPLKDVAILHYFCVSYMCQEKHYWNGHIWVISIILVRVILYSFYFVHIYLPLFSLINIILNEMLFWVEYLVSTQFFSFNIQNYQKIFASIVFMF